MSRYDDHDDYEEFVTREANKNFDDIKQALAAGDEPDIEEAIAALIWKEAERRAVAAAEQRVAPPTRRSSTIAHRAEELAWNRLQACQLEYSS